MALPGYNNLTDSAGTNDYHEMMQMLTSGRALRPFVNILIPAVDEPAPGVGSDFVIDDALNPATEKFNYLKTFQYTPHGNGASTVQFTLFDDRGHIRQTLTNIYNSFTASSNLNNKSSFHLCFRFGWSMEANSNSSVDRPSEKIISSDWHFCMLMGIEIQYVEGGISYQITGNDTLTPMQSATTKRIYKDLDIREAITELFEDTSHKPALPTPIFGEGDTGPKKIVNSWSCVGDNPLHTIREWLSTVTSDRNRPMAMFWDTKINKLVIRDIPPFSDQEGRNRDPILGPHDVNHWRGGSDGGTIVTRFTPKLNSLGHLASMAVIGFTQEGSREIKETLESAQASPAGIYKAGLKGQGVQLKVPTRIEDDGITTSEEALAKEKHMGISNRNFGVGNATVLDAELEIIGWPRADVPWAWYHQPMYLNVYYPYGLAYDSGPDGFMQWSRFENMDIDEALTGYWFITEATHIIDETGYKTKMVVTRMPSPDTQGIDNTD